MQAFEKFCEERLQADGYCVTTVSEYGRDKTEIPGRYYMGRKNPLDKDVIYTIEYIYEPDLIIFFLDGQRFCTDEVFNMVDIHISQRCGELMLNSREDSFVSKDYSEVYEYVKRFFTDQEH